jgi:very-short-patch-repair endonuclease
MRQSSAWEPICSPPRRLVRPVRCDPTGRMGPTPNGSRGPHWRRTSRGLFVPADVDDSVPEQRILEASALLPPDGVVTGWAALRLARAAYFDGLEPDGRTRRSVPLLIGPGQARRPRRGVSWLRDRILPEETWIRSGVPCARPQRALFDEIRKQSDDRAAVVSLDMAFAATLTSLRRMRAYLDGHDRWAGITIARRAWALADEDSWSPGESRTRLTWMLDAKRPRPLTNRQVFDQHGRLLGIADLLDPEAAVAGEYDGGEHARPRRRARDAAKDSAFRDHGLEVFRVTAYDEHVPGAVADRIDAAYRRAAHNRIPRRWTLTPPSGWPHPVPLDGRLQLEEVLQEFRERTD